MAELGPKSREVLTVPHSGTDEQRGTRGTSQRRTAGSGETDREDGEEVTESTISPIRARGGKMVAV